MESRIFCVRVVHPIGRLVRACPSGKLWRELYRELSVNSAGFDKVCGKVRGKVRAKVFENGKLGTGSS